MSRPLCRFRLPRRRGWQVCADLCDRLAVQIQNRIVQVSAEEFSGYGLESMESISIILEFGRKDFHLPLPDLRFGKKNWKFPLGRTFPQLEKQCHFSHVGNCWPPFPSKVTCKVHQKLPTELLCWSHCLVSHGNTKWCSTVSGFAGIAMVSSVSSVSSLLVRSFSRSLSLLASLLAGLQIKHLLRAWGVPRTRLRASW